MPGNEYRPAAQALPAAVRDEHWDPAGQMVQEEEPLVAK